MTLSTLCKKLIKFTQGFMLTLLGVVIALSILTFLAWLDEKGVDGYVFMVLIGCVITGIIWAW